MGEVWAVHYSDGWAVYSLPAHSGGLLATGLTKPLAERMIVEVQEYRD